LASAWPLVDFMIAPVKKPVIFFSSISSPLQ
jgi:hypothetical protein